MDNAFFIALLLLMMEVLPLSARITTASQRHQVKKKSRTLCVGGKWFQVGSFRFWQRSTCGQRRQAALLSPGPRPVTNPGELDEDGRTRAPTTMIDLDLILPSVEAGPKRNASIFDPNYGYEPYWMNGDWVFDKNPYVKDTATYMCGIKCPQVYTEFGKICGRNKNYQYQTFENYCQLRNKDCSRIFRWMVMYKGACYRELRIYERYFVQARAIAFMGELMKRYTKLEKYVGLCKDCPIFL